MMHDAVWQRAAATGERKWPTCRSLFVNALLQNRGALERETASLEALSPVAILNRGYALVFDAQGQLVKDASRVKSGEEVSARLARGRVRARVIADRERRVAIMRGCIRMQDLSCWLSI